LGSLNATYDIFFYSIRQDISYSEDNLIDIVRLGDRGGSARADILDHSTREDGSRDLMIGFDGDDQIQRGW
jgi:hypothetical protein